MGSDTSIDKIKTLYAHPQVFTQCSHFLAELGNVEVKTMDSTSSAMLTVSELKRDDVAAIGSEAGGNLYGLMAIKSNLANQKKTTVALLSLRATLLWCHFKCRPRPPL